jgi:hypothetical protein
MAAGAGWQSLAAARPMAANRNGENEILMSSAWHVSIANTCNIENISDCQLMASACGEKRNIGNES